MVLQGADDKKGNAKDDGSCNTVLSSDCVKDILKYVNSTAQGISGTYMGNSSYFKCSDLTKHLPEGKKSACWQKWSVSASSRFLPDSSLTANATNYRVRTCPSVDKEETNPFARNVFNTFHFNENGPNNFTSYDKALRNPLPMIVATWLKEDHSKRVKWEQGPSFVGTKLICIPANVSSPGSRTLAEALKSDSPARSRGGMIVVGMLSLAIGLVL
ncbi:hypothetical protein IFR05_002943 [Cadophora sp. M221]|nr:hypothetical protein IFR05_002943 [Cadophora sp. M221]